MKLTLYKHPPAADSEKPSARLLNIWIRAETLIALKIQLRLLHLASPSEHRTEKMALVWAWPICVWAWSVGVWAWPCYLYDCVCVCPQCVPLGSSVKPVLRPACAPTTVPVTPSMVPASVTQAGSGPTAPDVRPLPHCGPFPNITVSHHAL